MTKNEMKEEAIMHTSGSLSHIGTGPGLGMGQGYAQNWYQTPNLGRKLR